MEPKIEQLIYKAKRKMKHSHDPLHDLGHAQRVVRYAKRFCKGINLTPGQRQALILASWWHDMGRTITKNPSLVWMPLIDDTISTFMLWGYRIRYGLFGKTAGLATKIIFCKSMGTGAILTRILLRKKDRILVDIIKDADALDVLNQERAEKVMRLAESSRVYHAGYKITIWWYIKTTELKMKTEQARRYLEKILRDFIIWIKQKHIFEWHTKEFGRKWIEKIISHGEKLLNQTAELNMARHNLI